MVFPFLQMETSGNSTGVSRASQMKGRRVSAAAQYIKRPLPGRLSAGAGLRPLRYFNYRSSRFQNQLTVRSRALLKPAFVLLEALWALQKYFFIGSDFKITSIQMKRR
jgi:hypothetical protein